MITDRSKRTGGNNTHTPDAPQYNRPPLPVRTTQEPVHQASLNLIPSPFLFLFLLSTDRFLTIYWRACTNSNPALDSNTCRLSASCSSLRPRQLQPKLGYFLQECLISVSSPFLLFTLLVSDPLSHNIVTKLLHYVMLFSSVESIWQHLSTEWLRSKRIHDSRITAWVRTNLQCIHTCL